MKNRNLVISLALLGGLATAAAGGIVLAASQFLRAAFGGLSF